MKKLRQLLSKFSHDQKGAIAIIVALAMIPIMAASSAAIDYSRAFVVKNRLANALDATALAMGASNISNEAKLKAYGQKFFKANYPADKLGVPGAIQVTVTDSGYITVTGSAKLPTSLMGFVGINNLSINAESQVKKEKTTLEVVMVLDNTGSMGGSKLTTLKEAANSLVDTLHGEASDNALVKIGLVPFSSSVNVGSNRKKAFWIDSKVKSPLHGVNFTKKNGKGRNLFNIYNAMKNTSWSGCVEARSYPMDVEDTPPNKKDGKTLWVPYFYPDEPDVGSYYHNYLADKKNGSVQARQADISKYTGKSPGTNHFGSDAGPAFNCEISPLIPLTDKKKKVKNGINAMVANGSTVIPIGMAWGWRVISPEAPFTQGAPYNDRQNPTTKAIILMSDGVNFIGDLPNHNKSWYTGYGFVSQQVNTSRLNSTNPAVARDEVDARLEELCENVKGKGIIVFSVAFQITDSSTRDLIKGCASGDDRYFNASDPEKLKSAFKDIAKNLSELRISK